MEIITNRDNKTLAKAKYHEGGRFDMLEMLRGESRRGNEKCTTSFFHMQTAKCVMSFLVRLVHGEPDALPSSTITSNILLVGGSVVKTSTYRTYTGGRDYHDTDKKCTSRTIDMFMFVTSEPIHRLQVRWPWVDSHLNRYPSQIQPWQQQNSSSWGTMEPSAGVRTMPLPLYHMTVQPHVREL